MEKTEEIGRVHSVRLGVIEPMFRRKLFEAVSL